MVEGAAQIHHVADGDLVVHDHRALLDLVDAQDRDLGRVDHGGGQQPADRAQARDRERRAPDLVGLDRPVAGLLGQALNLRRQLQHAQTIRVLDHRDDQTAIRGRRDPDVVVALDDDLLLLVVDVGVEPGVLLQRPDRGLDDERQVRELDALLLGQGEQLRPQLDELRDVDLVDVGEVGRGGLGVAHVVGDALADALDGHALLQLLVAERDGPGPRAWRFHLLFLFGLGRPRRRGRGRRGGDARLQPLGEAPDVLVGDAAAGPRPLDLGDVDAQLAGQPPGSGRGQHPLARRRGRRRSRGGLLHRPLPLGLLGRRGRCAGGGRGGHGRLALPAVALGDPGFARLADHDEHRAHLHDLALLRLDLQDRPGHGRGQLHRGLVRHHLDEGLVLLDAVALLDQPADDLALVDALPDVGQLELKGHPSLRLLALAACGSSPAIIPHRRSARYALPATRYA